MSNPIFTGLTKDDIDDIMYMREGFACRCGVDIMLIDGLFDLVKSKYSTSSDYKVQDNIINEEKRQAHLRRLEEYRR